MSSNAEPKCPQCKSTDIDLAPHGAKKQLECQECGRQFTPKGWTKADTAAARQDQAEGSDQYGMSTEQRAEYEGGLNHTIAAVLTDHDDEPDPSIEALSEMGEEDFQTGLAAEQARYENLGNRMLPISQLTSYLDGDPPSKALVESVRQHGIAQAITVSPNGDGTFAVIEGRRRTRAAIEAELEEVPATLRRANATEGLILSLVTNYQRSRNFIQGHRAVAKLLVTGMTKEQIVETTGMTANQVQACIDVGKLIPELMAGVEAGTVLQEAAHNASQMPESVQKRLAARLDENGKLTVRDTLEERRAKQIEAARSQANQLFANPLPDLEMPEGETSAAEEGDEPEPAKPQRMSRTHRLLAIETALREANKLLDGLRDRTSDEEDVATFVSEALGRLATTAGD